MSDATTTRTGANMTKELNNLNLNLTVEEQLRLPTFFKGHVLKLLDGYSATPTV